MSLDENELKLANQLICQLISGKKYRAREIYASRWSEVISPKTFGKRFKNAVLNKKITSLRFVSKKTDNHSIYMLK